MADKFHERFDIEVSSEEARKRFVNRAYTTIFTGSIFARGEPVYEYRRVVALELGARYYPHYDWERYIGQDFHKCLHAIEALYGAMSHMSDPKALKSIIPYILSLSEVDLGVRWEDGRFVPAGAKLLDDALVNDSLKWLREKGYESVLTPFNKGLKHFLDSPKRPELLSDVITDMYEAVEALAKIVTGRDADLSSNREKFISTVKASQAYKKILKDYIEYANAFRHAAEEGKPKPNVSEREAESFMYLTGIFIRLAIQG